MVKEAWFAPKRRRARGRALLLVAVALFALAWARLPRGEDDPTAIEVIRRLDVDEVTPPACPVVSAESAILIDADTGRILFNKGGFVKRPMASTTKIMTAILALEHAKPDDVVVASKHASETPYTGLYLKPGEKLTVLDLLYAVLLRSANDACVALAEHIAGSEEKFVEMMNRRARQMGLKHTHFRNPHGLHADEHYSSAYDLAQMARYGFRYPRFAEIVAHKRKRIDRSIAKQDVVVVNKNRLVFRWDAVDGVKTGYTRQAGHCLVASASQGGWRLIAVALKSADSCRDCRVLLESGFRHFQRVLVVRKGVPLALVRVSHGQSDTVSAMALQDLSFVVPKGARVSVRTEVARAGRVRAPLLRGTPVGVLSARRGDVEIARTVLFSAEPVAGARPRGLVSRLFLLGIAGLAGLATLNAMARYGRKTAKSASGRRSRLAP